MKKTFHETSARNKATKFEIVLKKTERLEDDLRKKNELELEIKRLKAEKEEKRRSSEENIANLRKLQLEIDKKEIVEAEKRVNSLNNEIRKIKSDIKINLLRARRPISKILHSKDKKAFEFFQYFAKHPLRNINNRFWQTIAILEKENLNINESEKNEINVFLNFVKRKMNEMISNYSSLEVQKEKLEKNIKKISFKDEELQRNITRQKKISQKDLIQASKRLEEIENERKKIEIDIKEKKKMLEKILTETRNREVMIQFRQKKD